MLKELWGKIFGEQPIPEEDMPIEMEEESKKDQYFKLFRGEKMADLVGCPQGATVDQIERMTLIQLGPGTEEEDALAFLQAIREALPPHEAKNIVITTATNINVFRWQRVEETTNNG